MGQIAMEYTESAWGRVNTREVMRASQARMFGCVRQILAQALGEPCMFLGRKR